MIGLGTFYGLGKEVAEELKKVTGTDATVINPYYITGIDAELLEELKKDHDVVITLEDGYSGWRIRREDRKILRRFGHEGSELRTEEGVPRSL